MCWRFAGTFLPLGIIHVLGHLRCSALQGQLQGERGQGTESAHSRSSSPGLGRNRRGRQRRREPDGRGWCAHVAWWQQWLGLLCGLGEGAAAAASRVGTKFTRSPHACCPPTTMALCSVNHEPEAARQCWLHAAELPGPPQPMEGGGGLGPGGRPWGRWVVFLVSCTGSRHIRLGSALTVGRAWRALAAETSAATPPANITALKGAVGKGEGHMAL